MTARPPLVLFDDARPGPSSGHARLCRFRQPLEVIEACAPAEVPAALAALEAARGAGCHLAGYFAYELGLVLEPKLGPLLPSVRPLPLLWFGVFEAPEMFEGAAAEAALAGAAFVKAGRGRAYAGPLAPEWDEEAYAGRFDRVHDWIGAGDIYQANLSFRARFVFAGDPLALYRELRARAGAAHCAVIDDGTRHILSLSPELFFDLTNDGVLTARPMKGTAPRGADPASDEAAREALANSAKDRAENLMIVDLLRNDLGRIARVGSVAVSDLFQVETYPTLHTMVSTVSARLKPHTDIAALLKAIFPCGSITGAPKIRAMEIIAALEQSPRGAYCGAIGYFAPDGSARFNVAIRTLTLEGGRGELGIGGGVVHDSTAQGEYAECLLKARYFTDAQRPLELIETLRYGPSEGFTRLDRHLARMAASAPVFGLAFDRETAMAALEDAVASATGPTRVRLTLDEAGNHAVTTAPLNPPSSWPGLVASDSVATPPIARASASDGAFWRFSISPIRVASTDLLQRHKTNWRDLYEDEHARLTANGACDEVVFLNERGEIAEGARTNVFAEIDGVLVTPPLSAGILDGCLRQELIETGRCREQTLMPEDLARATRLYLGNSLRGLIAAMTE